METPFDDVEKINGTIFITETIADNYGFNVIRQVLRSMISEGRPQLLRTHWLTPNRLPFVAAVFQFCSAERQQSLRLFFNLSDSHPLNFFRFNRGIAHVREFKEAFNCGRRSKMYRKSQCSVFS